MKQALKNVHVTVNVHADIQMMIMIFSTYQDLHDIVYNS